jgi:hypothetical protein
LKKEELERRFRFLFKVIGEKRNLNKDLNVIRLRKINFFVGVGCLAFSLYISIMFLIPNNSFERITSIWGYAFLFLINLLSFILTIGSLNWKIKLNNETFTYYTYFGRKFELNYSEVNNIKVTKNLIIIKARKKYFFIDINAIGIEKLLKKCKFY